MADDKPKRPPSRLDGRSDLDSRGVSQLVALGWLLNEFAWPRNEVGFPSQHSPEKEAELRTKIKEAENACEHFVYLDSNPGLRRILGIVGRQVADMVAVRTIAYCSYVFLLTPNDSISIGQVAKTVGLGNPQDSLESRRIVYELIRTGSFNYKDQDFNGGTIRVGDRLRRYLNGDRRNPLLFDESAFQAIKDQSALRSATRRPTGINEADVCSPPSGQETQAIPSSCPSTASEIMRRMQEYVIGQNTSSALRRYCCRLAMHLQRKRMLDRGQQPDTPPEAILILGDSGSGKTHLVNTTAKILDLPVASFSACDITCEGYVGMSVSDAVSTLMRVSGSNPARSRTAVLHLDEWDKKRASGGSSRDTGIDVFGTAVQQGVLRIMEGQSNFQIGGRRTFDGKPLLFDSRGLLYLFSGAYTDLPDILHKQKRLRAGIGFGSPTDETVGMMAIRSALIEYGMLEEFVNRLTGVIYLPRPSIADLEAILIAPTGVLAMYNSQFVTEKMKMALTPEARRYLSEWAYESGLARGLKLVISCLAEQMVFNKREGLIFFDEGDVAQAIDGMSKQFG